MNRCPSAFKLIPLWIVGIIKSLLALVLPALIISLGSSSSSQTSKEILIGSLVAAAAAIVSALAHSWSQLYQDNLTQRFVHQRRQRLFRNIVSSEICKESRNDKSYQYQLVSRILDVDQGIVMCQINRAVNWPIITISLVIFSSFMILENWQLALIAIPLSFLGFLTLRMSKDFDKLAKDGQEIGVQARAGLVEILAGNAIWQFNRIVSYPVRRSADTFKRLFQLGLRGNQLRFRMEIWESLIGAAKEPAIIVGGIILLLVLSPNSDAQTAISLIFGFRLTASRFDGPVQQIHSLIAEKQQLASLTREVAEIEALIPEDDVKGTRWEAAPEVLIDNISVLAPQREQRILHECSTTLEAGSLNVIIGPSGSGKSTLFNAVTGALELDVGDVFINRIRQGKIATPDLAENIALLDQFPYFIEGTIWENITLLLRSSAGQHTLQDQWGSLKLDDWPNVTTNADVEDIVIELIEQTGLADDLYPKALALPVESRLDEVDIIRQLLITSGRNIPDNPQLFSDLFEIHPDAEQTSISPSLSAHQVSNLLQSIDCKKLERLLIRLALRVTVSSGAPEFSGGMRKKLALIRTLLKRPRLMFLDEPSSGLDMISHRKLVSLLKKYSGESTVFLVSHTLDGLEDVDCIHVMERGHVVQRGSYGELASAPGLFQDLLEGKIELSTTPLLEDENPLATELH